MSALSLLVAPTFAVMALVTAIGGGPTDGFCGTSPLGGMAPMYLLMSVFHAAPWLKFLPPRLRWEVSAKRTEGS